MTQMNIDSNGRALDWNGKPIDWNGRASEAIANLWKGALELKGVWKLYAILLTLPPTQLLLMKMAADGLKDAFVTPIADALKPTKSSVKSTAALNS